MSDQVEVSQLDALQRLQNIEAKLHIARTNLEQYNAERRAMVAAVMQSPEYKLNATQSDAVAAIVDDLTSQAKDLALAIHTETGDKKLPGVTIKELTSMVVVDSDEVRRYCLDRFPLAVLIDERRVLREAAVLFDTHARIPGIDRVINTEAQLASDLSKIKAVDPE